MRNAEYSSVNPENGNVTFDGPLSVEKSNHNNMAQKTDAYLKGDEKGHVNASSTGGINTKSNVVPQNYDVNHKGFAGVESGDRTALKNGAEIMSETTAIVDSKPGDRPHSFMINDVVTYADGHTEQIHHSFTNEAYTEAHASGPHANQTEWNAMSAALPDTFAGDNPADDLRSSMDTEAYAHLMQTTDAELPGLAADYEPADFSGLPSSAETAETSGISVETDAEVNADDFSADFDDISADFNMD